MTHTLCNKLLVESCPVQLLTSRAHFVIDIKGLLELGKHRLDLFVAIQDGRLIHPAVDQHPSSGGIVAVQHVAKSDQAARGQG